MPPRAWSLDWSRIHKLTCECGRGIGTADSLPQPEGNTHVGAGSAFRSREVASASQQDNDTVRLAIYLVGRLGRSEVGVASGLMSERKASLCSCTFDRSGASGRAAAGTNLKGNQSGRMQLVPAAG